MDSFTLNGLQIHSSTGLTNFFLNPSIEGLDSPEYRINKYNKPGEDGSIVSSNYYGGRVVSLQGKIFSDSKIQYAELRRQLIAACKLQRDSNNYPETIRCEFDMPDGNSYFFDAIPRRPVLRMDNLTNGTFFISLIVPDPQIYKTGQVSSGTVILPTPTGLEFPVTFPATFGGTVGGSATVDNTGDILSWPIITLSGQLTNPFILNSTTGKKMQLNYTLGSGDNIVIDMAERTILLNGSSSLINAKTEDSEWWPLGSGQNSINFNSGDTGDDGTLVLTFFSAYGGV